MTPKGWNWCSLDQTFSGESTQLPWGQALNIAAGFLSSVNPNYPPTVSEQTRVVLLPRRCRSLGTPSPEHRWCCCKAAAFCMGARTADSCFHGNHVSQKDAVMVEIDNRSLWDKICICFKSSKKSVILHDLDRIQLFYSPFSAKDNNNKLFTFMLFCKNTDKSLSLWSWWHVYGERLTCLKWVSLPFFIFFKFPHYFRRMVSFDLERQPPETQKVQL